MILRVAECSYLAVRASWRRRQICRRKEKDCSRTFGRKVDTHRF
jgi:hypothetical protein